MFKKFYIGDKTYVIRQQQFIVEDLLNYRDRENVHKSIEKTRDNCQIFILEINVLS